MDETIKIYRANELVSNSIYGLTVAKIDSDPKKFKKWQKSLGISHKKVPLPWTNREIFQQILDEQRNRERELVKKHPWFPVFYNWLIAILLVFLAASFIMWGVKIHTDRQISIASATALADYQAEQEAKEREAQAVLLAERNSAQAKKDRDIELMAKFLEGLSGFVKNKGYTDVDLYTYGQCPLNRVLNPAFWCTTLEEALRQENQWVGYSENNQVTKANKELATRIINEFYDDATRPCGYEYCWTEFTDKGLYLKSDFGPASFNNTWRAG